MQSGELGDVPAIARTTRVEVPPEASEEGVEELAAATVAASAIEGAVLDPSGRGLGGMSIVLLALLENFAQPTSNNPLFVWASLSIARALCLNDLPCLRLDFNGHLALAIALD